MNLANWIGRVGECLARDRIIINRLGAGGAIIDHRDEYDYPDFEVRKPDILAAKWVTEYYEVKSREED